MQLWEYKLLIIEVKGFFNRSIEDNNLEKQFNDLGSQGWELINSRDIESSEWTDKIIYVFRRPK